jgi:two-component system sensor histidine kinase PhcS
MQVSPEILEAYRERDRELSIRKSRIGCLWGAVSIPAFSVLDYVVYREFFKEFLVARLACAALLAVAFWVFGTPMGRRFHKVQGTGLLMLPVVTFLWMIYRTTGGTSPYYAGLTLVLLVLAVVLDWTFWQSLTSAALVVVLYLLTCWAHGNFDDGRGFLNNAVFLLTTGIIIAIGAYFHSELRLSEFASNYQLDKSRATLASQNQVLEDTLKQLKETESQLVQTEKIVSLGRLSAGLIHEINNPLNFAATGLYVLRNQGERLAKESPSEFSEVVQDINEGVERVKNIISDLRSFSHPDSDHRDVVKVAEAVTASLRFLGSEWKDKVRIEQEVPTDLACRANKNKLMQVFVNLIQNAIDALDGKSSESGQPLIRITGQQENGKIILRVRDNGEGIEPQNIAKIFDPFFTTRDIGEGMGMGLSICYRIIQEHQGSITVNSERGKFCEFTIELPDAKSESIAA